MPALLWIMLVVLLVILYLTTLVSLGVAALRRGHTVLFCVGIFFPVLWIVGALMEPTSEVYAARARRVLHEW